MKITPEIQRLRYQIKELRDRIKWIREHKKVLKAIPKEGMFCGPTRIDFDNLSHPDVIKVIRALGGKWKKSPNNAYEGKALVDYTRDLDGVEVRCWAGEPPPSCKLVEIEVQVPEKIIPAHTEKKFQMVCANQGEPLEEAIARAIAKQQNNNGNGEIKTNE